MLRSYYSDKEAGIAAKHAQFFSTKLGGRAIRISAMLFTEDKKRDRTVVSGTSNKRIVISL